MARAWHVHGVCSNGLTLRWADGFIAPVPRKQRLALLRDIMRCAARSAAGTTSTLSPAPWSMVASCTSVVGLMSCVAAEECAPCSRPCCQLPSASRSCGGNSRSAAASRGTVVSSYLRGRLRAGAMGQGQGLGQGQGQGQGLGQSQGRGLGQCQCQCQGRGRGQW